MTTTAINTRRKNLTWKLDKLYLGKRKLMEIYEHPDHVELYYVKDYKGKIYDCYNLTRAKDNAKTFALNLLDLEYAQNPCLSLADASKAL